VIRVAFSVGRVSIPFETIDSVAVSGDAVTITGEISEDTGGMADSVVARLIGYIGSEESGVPVAWDGGPSWIPGFYRVLGATSDGARGLAPQGVYEFTLELERVKGFAAPLFESVLLGAERLGVTTDPQPFHALPADVKGYETGVLTPDTATRVSETGDVVVFTDDTESLFDARPQYFVPPTAWYAGAVTLTVGGALVVGRQVSNSPGSWILSNGIIRLVGLEGGGWTTQVWDGSDWSTGGDWFPGRREGTGPSATWHPLDAPHTLTVMRNTPQSVAIRLTLDAASVVSGSQFAVTVDVELRRGSLIADVYIASRGSYNWGFLTPLVFDDATTLTDGKAESGFVIAYLGTYSTIEADDGEVTVILTTDGTSMNVGVGHHLDSGIDVAQSVVDQWAAVQSENVTVAAR
jgi:hypothetical protein